MCIQRPGARHGYDLWSGAYDATPNPVVFLDERVTPSLVQPRPGERILDAGCGTGRYFQALGRGDCVVVGLDFSLGMLRVARRKYPHISLVLADLQRPWPFQEGLFDVIVCALVGEHLDDLPLVFGEVRRVLRSPGRVVFSVYHPAMAAAGKEANFRHDAVEYRLGASLHSSRDYLEAFQQVGFVSIAMQEYFGDEQLAAQVPTARKYIGFPMLLVFQARNTV
jgi:SAM-dependent methyltransferase